MENNAGPSLMPKASKAPPPSKSQGRGVAVADAEPVNLDRPNAFIVDDEDGICKSLSMTLDGLGLAAESFHSAKEVVAVLNHGQPDIVFLDIALGESDAVDVIRTLGERHYNGVVQLMSGRKSALLDNVYRIGAMHGLDMCPPLQKPFRREAIRRAVARLSHSGRPEIKISLAPAIEPGLDKALANGWLELWYEPKIDLRTRALAGAEGVIRYRHPERGVHAVDGLLAQASAGTRATLTEHFVVTALSDYDALSRAGMQLRTAVNASFDALANVDLAMLARQHRPTSASWPGLILEISEHEMIKDLNLAYEIATQLRIYDITLAINNFGAGFSSFERLFELPFGELKLHAGFVADCAADATNAAICKASIDLAHRFGVVAVANGVDNASDLEALQDMGCDAAQGPLFAEPMPKSQFMAAFGQRTN